VLDAFQWVRETLFPRWDRRRDWRLTARRANGYNVDLDLCDWQSKRIHVLACHGGDELREVLVHEITHAVVKHSTMHGRSWQRRMLKAASRCREMGEHRLAEMIRRDVEGYKEDPVRVTAVLMYETIKDIAAERPEMTYDAVVDYLRREYPMRKRDFEQRFRRARSVFVEARRQQTWRQNRLD